MKRKIFAILTLAVTAIASLALFAACGDGGEPFAARFKEGAKAEIMLGESIDIDDYVVSEADTERSVAYSYFSAKQNKKVEGTIEAGVFTPTEAGEYTLVYTLKRGKKSSSAEFVLTVKEPDRTPTLSVDKMPVVCEPGPVLFDILVARANPQYTPASAELKLLSVTSRTFDVALDAGRGEETPVNFNEAGSVTLEEGKDYKFKFSVSAYDKTVEDYFNVTVVGADEGAEWAYVKDTVTQSSKAVFGEDGLVRIAQGSEADYNSLGYVVLAEDFTSSQPVKVYFRGKNVPSIGMFCRDGDSGTPWSAFSKTAGYILSFEKDGTYRWSLRGPGGFGGTAWKTPVEGRDFAWGRDDFEDDKTYCLQYAVRTTAAGDKYNHGVMFSVYEVSGFGTAAESMTELGKIDSGWADDFGIDSGKAVIYGSAQDNIVVQVEVAAPDHVTVAPNISGHNAVVRDDGSVRLDQLTYSNNSASSTGPFVANTGNTPYLAFEGDYGVGKFVGFEFIGKNIPNVCLFADSVSSAIGGGKGLFLSTGMDAALSGRVTVNGPWRLDPGDASKYTNGRYTVGYVERVATVTDSACGYNNLQDGKTYRYVVGSEPGTSNKRVRIVFILTDITDPAHPVVLEDQTLDVNVENVIAAGKSEASGNIIAYGSNFRKITFSYTAPYDRVPEGSEEDGTVYLPVGSVSGKTVEFAGVATAESYGAGKFVEAEFEGKNIPNIAFFADGEAGFGSNTAGQGLIVCPTGVQNTVINVYGTTFDGGSGTDRKLILRNFTGRADAYNPAGSANLAADKKYRYTVGFERVSDTELCFTALLVDITDPASPVTVYDSREYRGSAAQSATGNANKDTSVTGGRRGEEHIFTHGLGSAAPEGKIVFYGTNIQSVRFRYRVIDAADLGGDAGASIA